MKQGLFEIRLKDNNGTVRDNTADVFCVQRVMSIDPILNCSIQRTEFLIYNGGNWLWINANDCYLQKD